MEDTNRNFEIAWKISRTAYTMRKNNITVCKIEKPSNETSTPAQEQSNIWFVMKNTHVISVEWKMYALVINAYIISCPNVKLCGFDENDIFLEEFDDWEGIDLWDYWIWRCRVPLLIWKNLSLLKFCYKKFYEKNNFLRTYYELDLLIFCFSYLSTMP